MGVIEDHRRTDSRARRLARARAQILSLAQTRLRTQPDLDRLAEAVVDGDQDPYTAADRLLAPRPLRRTDDPFVPDRGTGIHHLCGPIGGGMPRATVLR